MNPCHLGQQGDGILRGQGLEQPQAHVPTHGAQHGPDILGPHPAATEGDGLVEQAQTVTHTAIRRPGQQRQGRGLEGHRLDGEDVGQLAGDLFRHQPLEVELEAARQDGHRHLLRVGGGEQELDVRRRFFQRLQQGIETAGGEHVHLVDKVHLEPPLDRGKGDIVQQFPGLIDPGAGGSVHLQQVDEPAFVNLPTGGALATRSGADTRFTVQGLGENAGQGGLTDPAGTGEEIGVVEAILIQRIA